MAAQKFELFMGCLGNGTTVCNKAVMERGDYKHIAHITPYGKIKLYVPEDYIPAEDMEKIKRVAEIDRQKFLSWWNGLDIYTRYGKVLDALPISKTVEIMAIKTEPIEEKVKRAETMLYDLF